MIPKVQIGCHYQRARYEFRSATVYQALMPAPGRDAELLQRALLDQRASLGERLLAAILPRALLP